MILELANLCTVVEFKIHGGHNHMLTKFEIVIKHEVNFYLDLMY